MAANVILGVTLWALAILVWGSVALILIRERKKGTG